MLAFLAGFLVGGILGTGLVAVVCFSRDPDELSKAEKILNPPRE